MNKILRKIKNNINLCIKKTFKSMYKNKIITSIFVIGQPLFIYNLDHSATIYQILSSSLHGLFFVSFLFFIFNFLNITTQKNYKFLSIKSIKNMKYIENLENNDFNYKTNKTIDTLTKKIKEHETA